MAVKGVEEEHQDSKAAVGRTAGMRGVEWTSMFAAKAKEGGGLACVVELEQQVGEEGLIGNPPE